MIHLPSPRPVYLKADVQGAELEVFAGAEHTLEAVVMRSRPRCRWFLCTTRSHCSTRSLRSSDSGGSCSFI